MVAEELSWKITKDFIIVQFVTNIHIFQGINLTICFDCNNIMEYSHTIEGRGRWKKELYKCPKCKSLRYKRVKKNT